MYVPIVHRVRTFAIGIYETMDEAIENAVQLIMDQTTYPDFASAYGSPMDKFLLLDYFNHAEHLEWEDIEFLENTICITIEKVPVGMLWDFTRYTDWVCDNLYELLKSIMTGTPRSLDGYLPCMRKRVYELDQ